jgi:uncharacterized protein YecE (DUF72 family)
MTPSTVDRDAGSTVVASLSYLGMASQIFVGTSGFVYPHWRHGVFYPQHLPQAEELAHYAAEFRTVELNSPFYRLPDRATFVAWKERTPGDFRFAVKASRYITHIKRLRECEGPVKTFFERARGLGRKLGPVLFQLPPNLKADVERLRMFARLLPRGHRCVFEFRHESWIVEPVFDVLAERSLAGCIAVGGSLEALDLRQAAEFRYLRMHAGYGREGNFTQAQLEDWAKSTKSLSNRGTDVYVYFNNDWKGYAIRNAQALRQLLGIER